MATNKLPEGSTWNAFKLTNITENQEVTVTFAADTNNDDIPDKYQTVIVTASADGSGTIDPSKKEITLGEDITFTVTPGEGQALYQVKVGDAVKYTNTAETPFSGTYTLEDVTVDTVVTFVFSVDTDGDGIPDASETWFTVTLNHDANTSISSNGVQDSVRVKIGQDCPIQFSAISGYAIDTVTVDDTQYINNGQTEAPNGTDWTGITLSNVQNNMTVSVTGAVTTDDTGVADKYKFTVTATITGEGGQAVAQPQLVVYGHDATINITPDEGMAVDSIQHGEETYVNNPNFGKAIIEDASDITEALSDPDVNELTLNAPIDTSAEIQIDRPMTLDGAGNTVTKSEPGKAFTFIQNSTVEDITIENTADNTEWNSSYGIQFYTGEHTVKDVKLTGGNAGIIANSATVNLEGTIDVSGNTFGGIEVCRSGADTEIRAAMPAGVLNINGATILNSTEEYGKPTIWIDGNTDAEGIVNGAEAFTMVELPHGDGFQKQFYLDAKNSKPIIVGDNSYGNLDEAINAVPANVQTTVKLMSDITVPYGAVEIPANKKVTLDLNGHIIASDGFKGRPITNKGELTVTGNGKITSEGCGADGTGAINNEGTLTIENGTFSGGEGANGAAINNKAGATCVVKDGEIIGCPRGIQNLGTLTIDGGSFIGSDTYSGNEGNAIINAQGATCTINDGTFTGHMNAVSNMDNGGGCQLTINGGTFTTDGFEASGAIFNGLGNTVTIEDGTFTTSGNSGATIANKGTAVINGGTFQGDNVTSQVYTISSGQGASSKASIELGPNVEATGTFGALRIVSGTGTIKGGTYKVLDSSSNPFYALFISSSSGNVDVSVENGTFESPNNAVRCGESGFSGTCTLDISNGSFTSTTGKASVANADPGAINITGGTYSSNVQDFVPDGYSVSESEGKFVVTANA